MRRRTGSEGGLGGDVGSVRGEWVVRNERGVGGVGEGCVRRDEGGGMGMR